MIGIRWFRLFYDGSNVHLGPSIIKECAFDYNQEAHCDKEHNVPDWDCHCGYYAYLPETWKQKPDNLITTVNLWGHKYSYRLSSLVWGWGTCQVHPDGCWRSQYLRIMNLIIPTCSCGSNLKISIENLNIKDDEWNYPNNTIYLQCPSIVQSRDLLDDYHLENLEDYYDMKIINELPSSEYFEQFIEKET